MVNKRKILRIGTFLCFLMFLLVPLMSSPVASAFTDDSSADTNSSGPMVTAAVGRISPFLHSDTGTKTGTFRVICTFVDTSSYTPGITSSEHEATIKVYDPVPEPPVLLGSATTGVVALNPGGMSTPTIGVGPLGYTGVPTYWEIKVTAWCQNLYTEAEDYDEKTYTICVDN